MRRVSNFETFIKGRQQSNNISVNEGLLSWVKSNINRLTGWAKSFYEKLMNGEIAKIPAGEPYAGKPSVMLYLPENGPIDKQVEQVYGSSSTNEAAVPLRYTEKDQSVDDVDAEEFKELVRELYMSKQMGGRAKPIFVYGAPGIGKTQIIGQVASELGIPLMDFKNLDVQFMNPEDFAGVPSQHNIEEPEFKEIDDVDADGNPIKKTIMTSTGKGFTRFNAPSMLPTNNGPEGKGGFIFLDEMNRAEENVLNKLMQFVQMGRLPDYQLPDKWVIIAAGNRPAEAEVAQFDFALANRFTIINYVPDVATWAKWALSTEKVLPELVAWLSDNQEYFHKLEKEKGSLTFPTPRSWADGALMLDDLIKMKGLESWRDVPSEKILSTFSRQVGREAAGQFNAYLEILRRITEKDINDIMNNPSGAIVIPGADKQKSIIRGASETVLRKIKDYDPQKLYNIMEYFSQYGQVEMQAWLLKSIYKKFPEFEDIKHPEKDPAGHALKLAAAKLVAGAAQAKIK